MTMASLLEWPLVVVVVVVVLLAGTLADPCVSLDLFNALSIPSRIEDKAKFDRNCPGGGVMVLVLLAYGCILFL